MKRLRSSTLFYKAFNNQDNTQGRLINSKMEADGNSLDMNVNKIFLNNNTELSEESPMPDKHFNHDKSIQDPQNIQINHEFCTALGINKNTVHVKCDCLLCGDKTTGNVLQKEGALETLANYCSSIRSADDVFNSGDSPSPDNSTKSDSENDVRDSQLNVKMPGSPELENITEQPNQNDLQIKLEVLTKKRTKRKHKPYVPLHESKKIKKGMVVSQDLLQPGCNGTCKRKCSTKISEAQRCHINKYFTAMNWIEQTHFIKDHTSGIEPRRRRRNTIKKYCRSATILYFLRNEGGEKIKVCKIFFLTTLGFNRKNDHPIRNARNENYLKNPQDPRRRINQNKINEKIITHINSFSPSISNYRQFRTSSHKYLPSDLNCRVMYKDFCKKNNVTEDSSIENRVSYPHYRKVVKNLNISFARLGDEDCEICELYRIHNPDSKIRHRKCTECMEFEEHNRRYKLATQEYEEDKLQMANYSDPEIDTMYYSVDLEKVILLPQIEEFKIVTGTSLRLFTFNESFVRLGDGSSDTFACIWHEAISGREEDDIASCFQAFFVKYHDLKHVVLWLDNSALQNKNWPLFSYLVRLVNSNKVNIDTVSLKYLEAGHTFTSSNEFHHQVDLSAKRKKRLYDLEDFYAAVLDTKRKITIKKMNVGDFCEFEDCKSINKLEKSSPHAHLNQMCEVIFRRGHYTLLYKNDFEDEEIELDFLRVQNIKFGIPKPKPKNQFRGIKNEHKLAIINQFVTLMPENKRLFWNTLHVDDDAANLINDYDE